ncbi:MULTISPECIES: GIY-YIG nuclease family protein [unclassified Caulobacter]|uniref:GIY-YIG nuclease family protein n=1 Tax=unclassified Caulobacter TaxID=2648921 RepID=UPI000D33EBBA|nr:MULTISPECIES: GIY-YIG nuclease family protein [unclassified Caulobacter]PTS87394.1 hypothetical protein DBR21_12750 [Caulobacter sp. HMWF009]PTT05708.1 hypothetical protein DBR10_14885 [Caulobacter sp. HMWF025]PTT74482.1 hypothetical protein DBR41_27325 [Pseudomonas sp. HMWF010]
MPLRLNNLLRDEGIDPADVRLLRHQTSKVRGRTPYTLWRDDPGSFETYQSTQVSAPRERSRFRGRYWASFVVPPSGATMFVGLYAVALAGTVPSGTIDPLTGVNVGGPKGLIAPYDHYECTRVQQLSDYIGRLFIHWGDTASASRAWVQRADNQDKAIVELTRTFREEEFPGFTKLLRPLSDIETMPLTWQAVLRATRGVYLLACPRTREHYVGSAYGEDGFLGRWLTYATTGHGGNIGLKMRDPSDYFVSILEVAGSNATVDEILGLEAVWKLKLHSRDIGLNFN